ncbi:MAG TPA: metal-dependent hydrolase [Anaerolineales bacterium]|nr:metal-dependent hydrolase [Anaerolineales bacterium]
MKGFSHFISAIAVATCVPGVLTAAADERSMILLLAGFFGVMPDWMDFKWARYFEPADFNIRPQAQNFDAQAIAEEFAELLERAYNDRKPVWVQLHSMQLGADLWQQYKLRFDNQAGEVIITLGDRVNTGQLVREKQAEQVQGRAKLSVPLNYTYDGDMKIDIFEGPTFELIRLKDKTDGVEKVEVAFLPWHRRWSHSLLLGGIFAVLAGLIFGWLAAAVVFVAFSTHILEDQLGYLGSNLFWPLTQRRSNGMKMMHSGDAIPNFLTVWLSVSLIIFNLNRTAPISQFSPINLILWSMLVPTIIFLTLHIYGKRKKHPAVAAPAAGERNREALEELAETEV